MKIILTFFGLVAFAISARAQQPITFTVNAGGGFTATPDATVQGYNVQAPIAVTVTNCAAPTVRAVYTDAAGTQTPKTAVVAGGVHTFAALNATEAAAGTYEILVSCPATPGATVTYTRILGAGTPAVAGNMPTSGAVQELARLFPVWVLTDQGIEIGSSSIPGYTYTGNKYTHIFLDQFGNTLLGVVPQGVSNRQYIVHVIYLTNSADPSEISYAVKQTKGSYSTALVFNNAGQLGSLSNVGAQASGGTPPTIDYVWAHQEFALRVATDNIEFEVYRNVLVTKPALALQASLVAKHTIEMVKIYHGSFDVGLLSTDLANPDYELMPSAADPAQTVVKESAGGNRGMVTVMATLYTSPIILFEKYVLGMDIPKYKLSGRNLFDDHEIYERIFPAIGVSLNEKAFKNIFYGLNWEVARGASLFVGFHYGEVNTFNADSITFNETPVNEAAFNLRKDTKWDQEFAFGANLDLLIITNLFR